MVWGQTTTTTTTGPAGSQPWKPSSQRWRWPLSILKMSGFSAIATDQGIESPYDPEARYRSKSGMHWTGYAAVLTETCDDDRPHLITQVTTTTAWSLTTAQALSLSAETARPFEGAFTSGYEPIPYSPPQLIVHPTISGPIPAGSPSGVRLSSSACSAASTAWLPSSPPPPNAIACSATSS